jgi:hypothetical protein
MGSLGANVRNSKKLYEQQNSFAGGINTTEENVNLSDTESRNIENFLLTDRGTLSKRLGSQVMFDVGRSIKENYNWMLGNYETINSTVSEQRLGIFHEDYTQEYNSFLENNRVLGHITKQGNGNLIHYLSLLTGIYDTSGKKINIYEYIPPSNPYFVNTNLAVDADGNPTKVKSDIQESGGYSSTPSTNYPTNIQKNLRWDWVVKVGEEGYYCYNYVPSFTEGALEPTYTLEMDGDTPKKYYIGKLGQLTMGNSVDPDNEAWWPVDSSGAITVRSMPKEGRWIGTDGSFSETRDSTHLNWTSIVYANPNNGADYSEIPDETHTVIQAYSWQQSEPDRFGYTKTRLVPTIEEDGTVSGYTPDTTTLYKPTFIEIIMNSQGSIVQAEVDKTDWDTLTEEERNLRYAQRTWTNYFVLEGSVYRDSYNEAFNFTLPFQFAKRIVFEDVWFNNQFGLNLNTDYQVMDAFFPYEESNVEINSIQHKEVTYILMDGKKFKLESTNSILEQIPYKPTYNEYNTLKGNLLAVKGTNILSSANTGVIDPYQQYWNWDWTQNPNIATDKKIPMILGIMGDSIPQIGKKMNFRAIHSTPNSQSTVTRTWKDSDGTDHSEKVTQDTYSWLFSWQYVMDTGDTETGKTVYLNNVPTAKTDLTGFTVPGIDSGLVRLVASLQGSGKVVPFHGMTFNLENSHFFGLRSVKFTPYDALAGIFTWGILPGFISPNNSSVLDYFEYVPNDKAGLIVNGETNDIEWKIDNSTYLDDQLYSKGTNGYLSTKGSGLTGFVQDLAFEMDYRDVQTMCLAPQVEHNGLRTTAKELRFKFPRENLDINLEYNNYGATDQPHFFMGAYGYISFEKNQLIKGAANEGDLSAYDTIARVTPVRDVIVDSVVPSGVEIETASFDGSTITSYHGSLEGFKHLGYNPDETPYALNTALRKPPKNYGGTQQDDIKEDNEKFSLRHRTKHKEWAAVDPKHEHSIATTWFGPSSGETTGETSKNSPFMQFMQNHLISPIPGAGTNYNYHLLHSQCVENRNASDFLDKLATALENEDFSQDVYNMIQWLTNADGTLNSTANSIIPPNAASYLEGIEPLDVNIDFNSEDPIKLIFHLVITTTVVPKKNGGIPKGTSASIYAWNADTHYDNEYYDNSFKGGTSLTWRHETVAENTDSTVLYFGDTLLKDSEPPRGDSTPYIINFPLAPVNNIEQYLPKIKSLVSLNYINNAAIYKNQFFLWDTTSSIVFYSDLNNFDYFPLIQTIELEDYPDEEIQAMQTYNDSALFFTKYHIYQLLGDSVEDYTTHLVNESVGAINSRCVKGVGNAVYFVSDKGAYQLVRSYSTDNQLIVKPIDTQIRGSFDPRNDIIATSTDGESFYIHILNKNQTYIYNTLTQVWTKWSYADGINMKWITELNNDLYYVTDDWKICRFNSLSDKMQNELVTTNDILTYQQNYIDKLDIDILFNNQGTLNITNADGSINTDIASCVVWENDGDYTSNPLGWNLENLVKYGYGYPIIAKWESKEWNGYANQTHNLKKWKETQIKFTRDSYASGGWFEFKVDGNTIIDPTYYNIEADENNELSIVTKNIDYIAHPTDKSVLTRNAGMFMSRSAVLSSGDYTYNDEDGIQQTFPEGEHTSPNGITYKPPYLSSTMQDTSEKNLRKKRGKKGYSSQTIITNDEPASFGIKSVLLIYKMKKAK